VVIVCAVRTPICKAKKGGLKDTPAEDLLATVLAAVVERTKIDPAVIGDVVVGSVLGSNVWRANQARIAMFLANYPDTVRACRRVLCAAAAPGMHQAAVVSPSAVKHARLGACGAAVGVGSAFPTLADDAESARATAAPGLTRHPPRAGAGAHAEPAVLLGPAGLRGRGQLDQGASQLSQPPRDACALAASACPAQPRARRLV
jgi:acetyl-CoA acetyltransferase